MRIELPDTPYIAGLSDRARFLLAHPTLFVAYYFCEPNGEKLKDFHVELIESSATAERLLTLFPAFHGKTTTLWRLSIRDMCLNPDVRIGYIAKNDREAQQIGSAIMAELMDNERLLADFGPFQPSDTESKPWALTRMQVHRRTLRAKEPTLALFGAGAKTTLGHRTDITRCDDVVTNENSTTAEGREKLRQWFNQNVMTMGRYPFSPLHVVGTRFHPADLYGDLEEFRDPETGESIWPTQRRDAIVDEETHETLWPEVWPWHALQKLRAQMGTLDFNKRLRNIAVDPSRMLFKEVYVKGGYEGREHYPGCIDEGYVVGHFDEGWLRAGGFDPAIGKTRHAKFCAHVSLALGTCSEHERCYWVIDIRRDQMTLEQQVECILEHHERYGLLLTMVEDNGYQAVLGEAVEARLEQAGRAYRIEGHTTGRHNKNDPEIGVMRMPRYFENGQVHIPWGNPESRRKMRQLVDELIQYPGKTTDTVMAFWFAWYALERAAPAFPSFNRLRERAPGLHRMMGGGRRVIQNPWYRRSDADDEEAA